MARNFLIVGTQRTGSSALGEAVGFHPQIACGWEWTLRTPVWKKLRVAEQALRGDFSNLREKARTHITGELASGKEIIGFRRLFRSSSKWLLHPRLSPALWIDRLEAHLHWLATRPDICVVHIVRRGNLGWLRSKVLSEATGRFIGQEYPPELDVTVPIGAAIRSLKAKAWVDRRLASLQSSNPYLRITYEEFSKDNRARVLEVVDFLGCDPGSLPPLQLGTRPQSKAGGASQIRNLNQLEEALAGIGLLQAEDIAAPVIHSRAGG